MKSCSRHVFDIAEQEGLFAGLRAFLDRFRACRPGYIPLDLTDDDGGRLVRLANGYVVGCGQLSSRTVSNLF